MKGAEPEAAPDGKRRVSAAELAELILRRGLRFARDAGGRLYVYQDGVYRPDGARIVQAEAKQILTECGARGQWTSHKCGEAARWIAADCPILWERPPLDVVNVRNGLLDLSTGELRPHSANFLSSIQLPISYDPAATCPGRDAFVEAVFPEDASDLAFELLGWLMTPDTSFQKAAMLIGDGANGKSRFLAGVRAFLGAENVASIPLHKLESDRFSAARLVGKLANIYADLPAEDLQKSETFRMLTGGNSIACERKFEESFEATLFSRLLFSCNSAPRVKDASNAFFRRWLVIPFDAAIRPEDAIPADELDALLASPAELSGALNRAVQGLRRLRARKALPEAKPLEEALHAFREACDPLAAWLERKTVQNPDSRIEGDVLYRAWAAHCEEHGLPVMSRESFGRSVRRLRPNWPHTQIRDGDDRVRVYCGVAWREGA